MMVIERQAVNNTLCSYGAVLDARRNISSKHMFIHRALWTIHLECINNMWNIRLSIYQNGIE